MERYFHGTTSQFDQFELRSTYRSIEGEIVATTPAAHFFSQDRETAIAFARDKAIRQLVLGDRMPDASLLEVRLNVSTPFDFTMNSDAWERLYAEGRSLYNPDAINPFAAQEFYELTGREIETWADVQMMLDEPDVIEALRDAGYDHAILSEPGHGDSVAVFDAASIEIVDRETVAMKAPSPSDLARFREQVQHLRAA